MEHFAYFVRRLLLIVPTFVGITALCFLLTQFIPGGPVEQALLRTRGLGSGEGRAPGAGPASISPRFREQIEAHFGFNRPVHERYWRWLVTDRIGLRMESYKFPNKTAWQLVAERLPVSLIFGLTGFLLSYLVCIPLGIAKALRHGSTFDIASSAAVFAAYAIPPLTLGMLLKTLLGGTLDGWPALLPLSGFTSQEFAALTPAQQALDVFRHMLMPVLCYVAGNFAVLTILMKNSLLDQVGRDYIRTVFARGGTYRRAIWGHALRNSLIPIATGFGGILTVMFAGSVIVEQIFEIPGMGRLSLEAIVGRDYPVFLAIMSLTSILGLLGNVLSDLCYVLIDPRIRFGGKNP